MVGYCLGSGLKIASLRIGENVKTWWRFVRCGMISRKRDLHLEGSPSHDGLIDNKISAWIMKGSSDLKKCYCLFRRILKKMLMED